MLRPVFALCLLAQSASAATFVVNSTADAPDQTIDGVCLTAAGECTLRAALAETNATSTADTIAFQITTPGVIVIAPASTLPAITNPVHIDGRTQSGYAGTPLIILDGTFLTAGSKLGLQVGAAGSEISALTVRAFDTGITLSAASTLRASIIDGNVIGVAVSGAQTVIGGAAADRNIITRNSFAGVLATTSIDIHVVGNYVGTPDGATVQGNAVGVYVQGGDVEVANNLVAGNGTGVSVELQGHGYVHDNVIGLDPGGTTALGARQSRGVQLRGGQDSLVERNTIANCVWGVEVWGAFHDTVRGNYIGTTSAGTGMIGNDLGIYIHNNATMNMIGGATSADRNVIVGSTTGILSEASPGNSLIGNLVGRDIADVPQPNTRGMSLSGPALVSGNVIASNSTYGLTFTEPSVHVTNNSIFANGGLGIDIGDPGPTLPNPGDGLQDIPLLAAASTDSTSTFIRGTVTGAASSTVSIEVFASPTCDPSGYGEGETRIGAFDVQTSSTGDASFLLPASAVAAGTSITATAYGTSSSEFSACTPVVICPTIAVAPATLSNPALGVAYTQSLTATGGAGMYTFSASGTLPPGVMLGADGTLAGTPSAAGTYAFTVTATDLNGCHGQRAYSLTVCGPISISPTTIADGTTQSPYNVTLSGSGGTPAYSFAITSGAAPAGLALASGGALTGTPTAGGDFSFTVTATDANACTGTQSYSVHIDSCADTLEPTTLPMAVTGVAYDAALSVPGGTAPISYAVTAGSLPAGLALVGDRITGTPTGSGDASFTITATDALGCAMSRMYTVTTTCAAITIAPASLDQAVEGQPYAATLAASGGAAPYTFRTSALPSGLVLSADGMLTGEPDAPGDYTFTVIATDANGCIGMIEYTLTIEPAHGHDGCGCATGGSSGGWTLILLAGAVLSAIRRRRA